MKRLFLIYSLILLATSAFAQNLFVEKYEKIRKSSGEESFRITRLSEKEKEEVLKSEDSKSVEFFKHIKTGLIGMDTDAVLDEKKLNQLINQYNELFSFKAEELDVKVLAEMKNEKIKELIFFVNMDNEVNFMLDLEFSDPVDVGVWLDLVEDIKLNDVPLSDVINNVSSDLRQIITSHGE